MATATRPDTATTTIVQTPGATELIEEAVATLDADSTLTLVEGARTGHLYTETANGYLALELADGTPTVTQTPTITEDTTELAVIKPGDNETIQDAVDTIRYSGD